MGFGCDSPCGEEKGYKSLQKMASAFICRDKQKSVFMVILTYEAIHWTTKDRSPETLTKIDGGEKRSDFASTRISTRQLSRERCS